MTVDVVADPQGSSLVTPVDFSQEPFITFARPYRRGPLAEFVGDGEDGALRLVGELDAPIQVDRTLFSVAADARYVVAIDLTVADASTNGPLGIGFFDVGAEFERVLVDLRAEPIGLGVATTDPSGRFWRAIDMSICTCDGDHTRERSSTRASSGLALLAGLVLLVDLVTKWASGHLSSLRFVDPAENHELMLGFPVGNQTLAWALSIGVFGAGFAAATRMVRRGGVAAWVLPVGAAGFLGNLLDRLALGYVRDWLVIGPTRWNVADVALLIAIAMTLAAGITAVSNEQTDETKGVRT